VSNRYIVYAALVIILVAASYMLNFYGIHEYGISSKTSDWADLGGFFGGVTTPVLSFITVVLLIQSLKLQNDANSAIKSELDETRKTEKIRSFEGSFFNMLNTQKELYDSTTFIIDGSCYSGSEAVMRIEDEIEIIQNSGGNLDDIRCFLEKVDSDDCIYNLLRAFYILVKITADQLSINNGFGVDARRSKFEAIIHFTNFPLLRLLLLSVQFLEYPSSDYLKGCCEFTELLGELELSFNEY
jgi:hypothetical protein